MFCTAARNPGMASSGFNEPPEGSSGIAARTDFQVLLAASGTAETVETVASATLEPADAIAMPVAVKGRCVKDIDLPGTGADGTASSPSVRERDK